MHLLRSELLECFNAVRRGNDAVAVATQTHGQQIALIRKIFDHQDAE